MSSWRPAATLGAHLIFPPMSTPPSPSASPADAARRALEALALGARVFVGDPERAGRDTFIRLVKDAGVDVAFDGMVCVLVPTGASSSERAPWR